MHTQTDFNSIVYRRNFLTEVIARIDLVSPIPSLLNTLPKSLAKTALKHFPIEEPKPAITQKLQVSAKSLSTQKTEFTEWNFYDRNREKRLTIRPSAFFSTCSRYIDYEVFRKDFIIFTNAFFDIFDEAQPSRLGLRYINELKLPGNDPLDWQKYINNDILGMFSFEVDEASPTRIFHNYEVAFSDFNLRFQFGIHNPDYPAPIKQRVFILDYDAYFKGLIEHQDIPEALDHYHTSIQKMFEQSISNELREYMNEPEKQE